MNILPALLKFHSGKKFSLIGTDYSGLSWLDESPKPTEQELLGQSLSALKDLRILEIKKEAGSRILAAYPGWKQMNCSNGMYDAGATQAIKDGINAIRSGSNAAEAAVSALTTVEAVQSFTW